MTPAEQERAAVVAFLRRCAELAEGAAAKESMAYLMAHAVFFVRETAAAIEAGQHLSNEAKGG